MQYLIRPMLIFSFTVLMGIMAVAQKLKNEQDISVWSSVPIKVDGKVPIEDFKAYNKATGLFYTLSNDAKNIYLVMKSVDDINNAKIMMGGITFTVNTDGKKKEKDACSVSYPVIVRQRNQAGGGNLRQRSNNSASAEKKQSADRSSTDSVVLARRRQQLALAKEIKISGFKEIKDSLISIYNEHNILAVSKFDDKGAYVYELAIPLRLLGLDLSSKEISYNLKVNGREFGMNFQGGGFGAEQGSGRSTARSGFDPSVFSPTDFWADYKIATGNK
jgi:hypothetical protein